MRSVASSSLYNTILLLLAVCSREQLVDAFGPSLFVIPDLIHLHANSIPSAVTSLPFFSSPDSTSTLASTIAQSQSYLESASSVLTSALGDVSSGSSNGALEAAWTMYSDELKRDPLKTKVLTGVVLAVVGDALAQSRQPDEPYNVKRATSFVIFDGCYRAVQQFTYPPMIQACSGKFSLSILTAALGTTAAQTVSTDQIHFLASIEQTLVSQLVIIPTLYYPVFFAITGAVQGLTLDETLTRAKETFIPLMKRNLLFWIPVQFFAFAFIEENLQIPILIVCGLVWTIILSVSAGAAKANPTDGESASNSFAENSSVGENVPYDLPENEMERMDLSGNLKRLTTNIYQKDEADLVNK